MNIQLQPHSSITQIMSCFEITRTWDFDNKTFSEEKTGEINENKVLVKVNKVLFSRETGLIQGSGKVVAIGSNCCKLLDKEVAFLKFEKNLVKEFEVVEKMFCLDKKEVLYANALTALMVKEFISSNKFKRILHISENKILSSYLKSILTEDLVTISNKKEVHLLKIFDFDLLVVGETRDFLQFSLKLQKNVQVFSYSNDKRNYLTGGKWVKMETLNWFSSLSKLRRSQYINLIKENPKIFNEKISKKENSVLDLNFSQINEAEIDLEILFKKQLGQSHSDSNKDLSISSSIIENDEVIKVSSDELDKDFIGISCLQSPRHYLKPKICLDPPEKSEPVFSGSTYTESCYEDLNFLISKYKNEEVDQKLSKFDSVFYYNLISASKYKRLLSDSSIYEGELSETDQPDGFGSRYFSDGTVFRGWWKEGKAHGKGLMVAPDGFMYFGLWKKGTYHGYGTLVNEEGDLSEGVFKKGELEGSGIQVLRTGEKYQGNFSQGLRNGKGWIMVDGVSALCEYDMGVKVSNKTKEGNLRGVFLNIPKISFGCEEGLDNVPEDVFFESNSESYISN